MKPYVAAIIAGCLFCLPCKAQKMILLETDPAFTGERIQLPFKNIIVADARFSKTSLGFVYSKAILGIHTNKKQTVNFPDSLQNYLPHIIENFAVLSDTGQKSLFILVKKFRVSELAMTSIQGTINNYLTLNLSASFYTKNGNFYYKNFSVDDIIMDYVDPDFDVKLSFQYIKHQRAQILIKMLYKLLAYRNWGIRNNAPGFNEADVKMAIEKRFMLPVYSHQAATGLYKSFEEFKNAMPSVKGISIIYRNNEIDYIVDSTGKPVQMNNYWGVSDGKKNFLFFRQQFTELLPSDKSFHIISYLTTAELNGRTPMNTSDAKTGIKGFFEGKKTETIDLDMDTGELFLEEIFGKSRIQHMNTNTSK